MTSDDSHDLPPVDPPATEAAAGLEEKLRDAEDRLLRTQAELAAAQARRPGLRRGCAPTRVSACVRT